MGRENERGRRRRRGDAREAGGGPAGSEAIPTITLIEEDPEEAPLYADDEVEAALSDEDYSFDTTGADLGGLADPNQPPSANPYDSDAPFGRSPTDTPAPS